MNTLMSLLLISGLVLQGCPCETTAQTPPGREGYDTNTDSSLLKYILESIEDLQKTMLRTQEIGSRDQDPRVLEKIEKLQSQVTSLSSQLITISNRVNTTSYTIFDIMAQLAQEMYKNRKYLDRLSARMDKLHEAFQRKQNQDYKHSQARDSAKPETPSPSTVTKVENNKEQEEEKRVKEEKRRRLVDYGLAQCSRANKNALSAISGLSQRVRALERYTSPKVGALANASKAIGENFGVILSRIEQLSMAQRALMKGTAEKLHSLEKAVKDLRINGTRKQDRLVVETATAFIRHNYLSESIRIDFKKQFTKPPLVYAAIAGFAMDPDHETVKKETNKPEKLDSLNTQIFTVQANFYAARIEYVSAIDALGFSVRVYDGRDLSYSSFQWVQVQWIAIGT